MNNIMIYIVIKNNIIIEIYHTSQGIDGIIKSLQFEQITDYDIIQQVPNDFNGTLGMNIQEFDENWNLLPEEERIIKGFIPPPKGKKIKDGKIVDKSLFEQIHDGDIKIEPFQIYDETINAIRTKTEEEILLDTGLTLQQIKLQQVSRTFEDTIANGHFFSQSLQIEVDCRRSDVKNDLQNVENLITFLTSTNTQTIDVYRGYTNPETNETQYAYNVTLEQLQQLKLEMIQYGLQLYNRKWQLEDLINNASTLSDLDNISIDFTIH